MKPSSAIIVNCPSPNWLDNRFMNTKPLSISASKILLLYSMLNDNESLSGSENKASSKILLKFKSSNCSHSSVKSHI